MVQPRKGHNKEVSEAWLISLNALKEGLSKIQKKDSFELSFEELYRMTYDIVREKKFQELYDAVHELIITHIQVIRSNIHHRLGEDKLDNLIKEWNDYNICSAMFRDVLMFLDQAYVFKEDLEGIYNMSMHIFRNEILRHGDIRECIQNILLGMVHAERTGQLIDHTTFKSIINMLLFLSKLDGNDQIEYRHVFEDAFLLQTTVFYKQEAQSLLSSTTANAPLYIENYKQRHKQEKERLQKLLHESSETRLFTVLDNCLIKEHLSDIINMKSGLRYMLENALRDELTIIYEWYKKYSKENELVEIVSQTFHEYGLSIVDRPNVLDADQAKIVNSVLELKEKYENYEKICFQNNEKLRENIEIHFIAIFNQNPRMAEFFSAYIHQTMKKDGRDMAEEKLDEKLDTFMKLFRILSDKDVFERFYKNHLTKRLLTKPNLEIERKMISKLKAECGHTFTQNLEAMLTDIQISSDHMDLFNNEIIRQQQSLCGIDFSITIVQSGAWRIAQFPPCILPSAPSTVFQKYTDFYYDKHSGRKLTLQSNFGSAMLKAYYEKSEKNPKLKKRCVLMDVSTIQMTILMLFNEFECLTIEEINHKTNIPEKNLITSLNPMVLGKPRNRILRRVGEFTGKVQLSKDSVIAVNDEYYSREYKIKLPFHATHIEDASDREVIQQRTNRERGYEIDAAAIRVMKMRNVLSHRDLVAEIIQQLKARFKPDVKFINNRISSLIDREYIEKKADDPNMYLYIS